MLFRSPHDPLNTQANQELIILCHVHERVLVPLPKSYQEIQQVSRDEFHLTGDFILETTDLLGADEPPVRIHPRAWEGIRTVLRTVSVKLAHAAAVAPAPAPPARPRPSEALSGSRRLSQKRISVVNGAAPIRLSNGATTNGTVPERQSLSARKGPFPPGTSRPSSIVASHGGRDLATQSSTASGVAPPSSSTNGITSARTLVEASSPVSQPLAQTSKIEELDDDYVEEEEEEEIRIPSPTKKRAARQRVMSDYGLDGARDEEVDERANSRAGQLEAESDEDEDDRANVQSPLGSRSGRMSRAGSASVAELDGPPTSLHSARKAPSASGKFSPPRDPASPTPDPKIKLEAGVLPSSSKHSTSPAAGTGSQGSQSAPSHPPASQNGLPKGDESFLVAIEYADDPESRSLFKTRGRHMVSKVLMQACRTFGLEEYYHSAQLILLVEEEDEDGEVVLRRRYACGRDETMAEAGAEPNSRFVVDIEYDEDDD